MYFLTLTLLCAPTPDADGSAWALPDLVLQEPAEGVQEEVEKKPKKKKFARLTSPMKKEVGAAMRLIAKGEEEEEIAEGVARLIEVGEAAVPSCFDAVKRMEEADRLQPLWQVLDTILVEEDLELGWSILKKKASETLRVYLVRRFADSTLKAAPKFLAKQLESEQEARIYEAARGLAWRGEASVMPILEQQVRDYWLEEAERLRTDFAGIERGPLTEAIEPLLLQQRTKEKLAALRLVELFGDAPLAKQVAPFLSESDTTLRLAAINACRVVIDGEAPLARPSMTEIIERAEAWKAKL